MVVTGVGAVVTFASSGALWVVTHDDSFADVVWPLVGVVLFVGVTLFLAVHVHVRALLRDGSDDR